MIISLDLTKGQQATLKKIVKSGNSSKIRLSKSQLEKGMGQHFLKLNMPQSKKVMSAMNRKKGLDIEFTKPQIVAMSQKQQGGFVFLPFLIAAAEAAAPYVASAVGGYVADKAIGAIGDALFGTGLEPYRPPQEGGAWYENKGKDRQTNEPQKYSRSKRGVRTVCFVKGASTQPSINNGQKIAPQKRGRSTGRPRRGRPPLVPRDGEEKEGVEEMKEEPLPPLPSLREARNRFMGQMANLLGSMSKEQVEQMAKSAFQKRANQQGGAWFESKPGEDTYMRDADGNRVVCFEKYTNPGRIEPETRAQSRGRPAGARDRQPRARRGQRGGCYKQIDCAGKKKNKK
jgi:hypothetical protein